MESDRSQPCLIKERIHQVNPSQREINAVLSTLSFMPQSDIEPREELQQMHNSLLNWQPKSAIVQPYSFQIFSLIASYNLLINPLLEVYTKLFTNIFSEFELKFTM